MAIESCGACGSQSGHLPTCQHFRRKTYRVEIAEKIGKINGRACSVGILFGVAMLINGNRCGWVIVPQEDEEYARNWCAEANRLEG